MLGPLTGHWGCSWLCGPGILCLLAAGHGNTEHRDLKDEGNILVPYPSAAPALACAAVL